MAHEWNIRPRGHVCNICGKPFEDGQECVSALYDTIEGFTREDCCMPCWSGKITDGDKPFSVWQGAYVAPDKPGKTEPVRKESAEQLLRRLVELDDPAMANVVYVLAVMLERSRQLVERDAKPHESGGTIRIYEQRKTGDIFTVLDPHLRLDALADVQRQVVELLNGPAPAAEAPADGNAAGGAPRDGEASPTPCIVTWPLPPEMPRSADYRVKVNGVPVDALEVPRPQERLAEEVRFPYAFASFEAEGEVTVEVELVAADLAIKEPRVWPMRMNAAVEQVAERTVRFKLNAPCDAAFEPDGRHRALIISARPYEKDAPKDTDPGVIYVGPGIHRREVTQVGAGQTLYVAGGAVLEGAVSVNGDNACIRGRGIISGAPWPWLKGPRPSDELNFSGHMVRVTGRNVSVRDVAMLSPWGWTLTFSNVEGGVIEGVKILGGRVINDDGIDLCSCRDIKIGDCCIRCQDDCFAPKWWCENIDVASCTLWCDVANVFRVGYECTRPPAKFKNLSFRDIDILHTTLEASETTSYWANCVICVQASNECPIEDVAFEDLRVHELGRWDIFLIVKTMPLSSFYQFPDAGTISGVMLKNIHLPACLPLPPVRIEAHDDAHPVSNVRFEDVTGYGCVELVGKVSEIDIR